MTYFFMVGSFANESFIFLIFLVLVPAATALRAKLKRFQIWLRATRLFSGFIK